MKIQPDLHDVFAFKAAVLRAQYLQAKQAAMVQSSQAMAGTRSIHTSQVLREEP